MPPFYCKSRRRSTRGAAGAASGLSAEGIQRLIRQCPVELYGFIGLARAVVNLGQLESRQRRKLLAAGARKLLQGLLRLVEAAQALLAEGVVEPSNLPGTRARVGARHDGEFLGRVLVLVFLLDVGDLGRLGGLPRRTHARLEDLHAVFERRRGFDRLPLAVKPP